MSSSKRLLLSAAAVALAAAMPARAGAQNDIEAALKLARAGDGERAEEVCTRILADSGSSEADRAAVDLVRAEVLVKEWQVREAAHDLPDGDRVSEGEVRVVSLSGGDLTGGHATHFWRTPLTDEAVWTIRTRTGRQVTTSRSRSDET